MGIARILRQKWLEDISRAFAARGFVGNTLDLGQTSGVLPSSGTLPAHASTHKSGGSDPVSPFGGEFSATDLVASGLTGATAAGRWVGTTTSGAPATGAFLKGDWITTQNGFVWICTTAGSPGTWANAGSAGSVTSVGLTMPSDFTVAGSPVTGAGTIGVTANNQSANTVKAGPTSGGAAAPTYRALVPADLPVATTSAFGAVKPDGTTITVSGGVISSTGGGSSGNKITLGTIAGGPPGSPGTGDEFDATDGLTSQRWDGTKWRGWFSFPLTPMPSLGSFSWQNQGAAAATDNGVDGIAMTMTTADGNLHILDKAAPATPYTITVGFIASVLWANNFNGAGICFRNSGAGTVQAFYFNYQSANGGDQINVENWNSPTSFNASVARSLLIMPRGTLIWLRIKDDGTSKIFDISGDGKQWVNYLTQARTSFLTADRVGLVLRGSSSANTAATFLSWSQT